MSSHLGVKETLELLESLKGLLREFAATEEKLNLQLRAKISSLHRRRDEAINALATRLSEEIEQADAYEPTDYKRVLAQLRSGLKAWVYLNIRQ